MAKPIQITIKESIKSLKALQRIQGELGQIIQEVILGIRLQYQSALKENLSGNFIKR